MLSLRKSNNDIDYDTYIDGDIKKPTAILEIEKKISLLQKECSYETIVDDSLTSIAEASMNRILFANGRAGGVPQLQDWLQQMNWIRNHILTLRAMPVHVVVIAHEAITQDENTGAVQALPLLTGKLAGRIGAFFDEVYNAQAISKGKETVYRLLTKANSIYTAKSRLGCLEMYEEPDFKTIMAKVKGEE